MCLISLIVSRCLTLFADAAATICVYVHVPNTLIGENCPGCVCVFSVSVCTYLIINMLSTTQQIGGEYQTSSSPETQLKRSIAEELRGVAVSLVEQVVYEGPQLISHDELLMELIRKNNGVQSVSVCVFEVITRVTKYSQTYQRCWQVIKHRWIVFLILRRTGDH